MICPPHQILLADQIKKNEIGGACGTYGKKERFIQGKYLRQKGHSEDLGEIGA
jgi:hypothetical protein